MGRKEPARFAVAYVDDLFGREDNQRSVKLYPALFVAYVDDLFGREDFKPVNKFENQFLSLTLTICSGVRT